MIHLQNTLIQLKNGYNAQKSEIKIINTKKSVQLLKILKGQGFIKTWAPASSKELKVYLKYTFNIPSIKNLTTFIKPSISTHISFKDLSNLKNSLGLIILDTSYGLITKDDALVHKIGGYLVCSFR